MAEIKTQEILADRRLPFTVADQCRIDSMDDETRALVERYTRAGGSAPAYTPRVIEDLADRISDSVGDEVRRSVMRAMREHAR